MTKHILTKLAIPACAVFLGLASTALASVPPMEVTVFDGGGKVEFQGPTNANAVFATRNLQPGNYVVQFKTRSVAVKNNQYLLVVSAGKQKVIADSVPGEKFTGGGVAMRVEVGPGLKITGQVANEVSVVPSASPKVRVINGKRYVWVIYSTGSNLGGHWEEEGLAPIRKVATISFDDMRMIQDRAFEGNILNRYKDHLYEYVGHRGY